MSDAISSFEYSENTAGVLVTVQPQLVTEKTNFKDSFCYSYKVSITNKTKKRFQLMSRHWIITDGTGKTEEVVGDGVIGEQPQIEAGKSFEYSSFCPLPTPTGNMRGSYVLVGDDGVSFKVKIPLFFLRDEQLFH